MAYVEIEKVLETARDEWHSDFGKSMADLTSLREVLEDTPTADVVLKEEVDKIFEDFQGSIRADAKVGMSAGEILMHIHNMLVEFKKKYTGDKK